MNKKVKISLIIFGIIVFVWYSYVGVVKYMNWKWYEGMKKEAVKFEKELADKETKIMSDTYGGKTPQETLVLFITAVEDGDYELASKYFVVERQGEWENELFEIKQAKKIDIFLDPLKETLNSLGEFSKDSNRYFINDPVSVDLIIYPSNLWKIDEI